MSAAPRQYEDEREATRRPEPAAPPALAPATILGLQRTVGNRAVARQVTVGLRQPPPPRPKAPPASEQASPENRELAAEIDTVDKLDDPAFDKARGENAKQVAETEGAAHAEAVEKRDALEYVAAQRQRKGPKLDLRQWRYVRADQVRRRQFLNALVAQRAEEEGSFEQAMTGLIIPDPSIEGDLAVIRADATAFRREFKGQARINAERMLRHSHLAIIDLLHSYGIPADSATVAAERILKGGGTSEETAAVVRSMKRRADEPGGANEAGPTRHRFRLAQWVERLKAHQVRVRDASKASNHADMNVSVASTPADDVARKARQTLKREKAQLSGLWIQAERMHPLLAAYRSGGPLEQIDLGALDSENPDTEMSAVLEKVLPKIVSIAKANHLIKTGAVSPLSLTPVVAMTRANMFVPPGSVRAAVVRDLLAEAKEGQSGLIMLLSFALAIVTLVPSGGASLAVAAGAASAGLAAYTALHEFQTYEHNKTLVDTDLDRARALSNEEPSLAAFAMTLVGLGLEAVLLGHAFKTAVQLRRMAMAGEESARLQKLLDELNTIGKEHNAPGLGKQVLDDAVAARPKNVLDGDAVRRPPSAAPSPTYRSHGEVRHAATKALLGALRWGDGPMLSKEYKLLYKALKQNAGPINEQLAEALPHVIKGIRNPELYGEVLADAWALAKGPPPMDINAALETMARSGGAPVRYIDAKVGEMLPAEFFKQYGGQAGSFIDLPFQNNPHGAMTHLLQDLVVDRALHKAGGSIKTSTGFRGLLGKAEGMVAEEAGFATQSTMTFVKNEKVVETQMKTGDYIWRMVYDNTGALQINRPEAIGDVLINVLGIR